MDTPFAVIAARLEGESVRRRSLLAPFYGVRAAPLAEVDDEKWWQRRDREVTHAAEAFMVRMPEPQVFSHLTAALLHGLRVPPWATATPLHVGALHPDRAPRLRGVRGHSLQAATPLAHVERMRVTAPVETWCGLAETLHLDDLIVMGDGLVCRQNPIATMEELGVAVERCAGRPGVRKLRLALGWIRPGTDSTRETQLRLLIVRAGYEEPGVNGRIINEHGAFVALADLVYRRQRVIVEYDGGHHREDERQSNRDVDRLDDLMELDYRVIRVNRSLLVRPPVLLGKLRTALRRSTGQDDM